MRFFSALLLLALASCATRNLAAPAPSPTTPTAPSGADACVVGPRVVSSAAIDSGNPVIASRRDEFAVVWEERAEQMRELHMTVFDGHGEPLTGNLVVARLGTGGGSPRLAATEEGYVLVWAVDRDETTALVIQRTDARGRPLAPPTEALSSPTARPLAMTNAVDGFVVVWWQWARQPHLLTATWLDARGRRVGGDIELTRMPCEDPVADVRRDADGRMRVTWEQAIGGDTRVIVGLLSRDGVVRQGSEYVGRDPALLRDGVAMTALGSESVLYAPFGTSSAAPLVAGRMADAAVLGNDSVLCRVQRDTDGDTASDVLRCNREKAGTLLRERTIARSEHTLGSAQIADTSLGYVVALEGKDQSSEETGAVHVTVVTCND